MQLKTCLSGAGLITLVLAMLALPAYAQDAATATATAPTSQLTTFDRLLNAKSETSNWLTVHGTYDSHRYSPLDQINGDNVGDLQLQYVLPLNVASAGGRYTSAQNEGTPLVEDGYMYVQSGWSVITKVDLHDPTRAKILWRHDPEIDRTYVSDTACCGAENRGIGLWNDQVIALTMDGRMLSLNKDSGKVTWEKQLADKDRAETFTTAPQIIKDMAIIGPAGGEYGIRGWLAAIDLKDGAIKWKTYTVPGPGEPGNETWEGRDWETGGAPIWETGSYDPELNLIYWGTGNPAPQFDAEYRPGDNLYSDSLLALDPDTGEIKWHFQYTPNDPYDHDEIGDSQLIDAVIDGEPRKLIVHVARNGFVYVIDRTDVRFVAGEQYVEILNWTEGLDPVTGRPLSYDPSTTLQSYVAGTVARRGGGASLMCPGLVGGRNWQPASYSESANLLFAPSTEGCNNTFTAEEVPNPTVTGGTWDLTDPKGWRGRGFAPADQRPDMPEGEAELKYSVNSINPVTGELVVKKHLDYQQMGMLSTAGDLVFSGDNAGNITAFDAKTLDVKWQINIATGIYGPPITYTVDGKQYIAILAGGPGATGSDPSLQFFVPQDAVYVFAL